MRKIKKVNTKVPSISTEQMIEVDRLMIEEYGIELIQMMENAGRCLAILAKERFLRKRLSKKQVVVLAGPGGNGGGAMVCARRLHNWGAKVQVYLTSKENRITPISLHQLHILKQMNIPIHPGEKLSPKLSPDLIIDGIIGYSIKGDPYGIPKTMIEWTNQQNAPTLSLDTPSGLDLTSGNIHSPTIQADATLTLALPKHGLFEQAALPYRGELYLGDISVPPALYAKRSLKLKVKSKIFDRFDVVRLK